MRTHIANISLILVAFAVSLTPGEGIQAAESRVLFLGDSLSMGAFGRTLDQSMRSKDLKVYTHVAGGASPYYWLRRYEPISCSIGYWEKTPEKERRVGYIRAVPKVEDLLDNYKPKVVVVQTGVNLYATLRSKRRAHSDNVKLVEGLIGDMCNAVRKAGAHSYWITPPESHPKRYPPELQAELTKIMKRVVGNTGGKVFESGEVTEWTIPYPSRSDGIHYGPIEAKAWAEKVAINFSDYVDELPSNAVAAAPTVQPPLQAVRIEEHAPTGAEPEGDIGRPSNPELTAKASDEIQVKMILKHKSLPEHMNEVTYDSAFGVFEYEVADVYKGEYPFKTVRVAHMVVLNKKKTGPTRFRPGNAYYLTLMKLDKYPSLARIQIIDKLEPNFDLPIYVCKF